MRCEDGQLTSSNSLTSTTHGTAWQQYVTLDKESNMSTLWRQEEFLRICCKEDLAENAQDLEVTTPVKKSQEV
jgi:hypothetical protein